MRNFFLKIGFILFLVFSVFSLNAQTKYSVSLIPDSLKEHADAVIRYAQTDITVNNINNATAKIKKAVTILNKSGKNFAYITVPYDKLSKFISLKGRYYDEEGKFIKFTKNKDIKDISYYEGLYSDNRLKYVEPPALNPPYTVEYEIETEDIGILDIVNWFPIFNYNLSAEKSVLNVVASASYKYRINEKNFNGIFKEEGNKKTWIAENIKAVQHEPYNSSIQNLVPHVHLAPSDFSVEGFAGNMNTWQNFGKWIMLLNQNRNELPEETVIEIRNLIKGINDDREKAKAVYNYMQNKTRYVSIQLGIGGWQPFEANYTDRNGYGDCKALSYYTQSLLNIAGIKSFYTIIKAGNNASRIDKNFPSLQFNHVILCVPFDNDTVWLECTDQKIPFGYLSDFTDDRDALLINENGGQLVHTVSYDGTVNTQIRKSNIELSLNGDINAGIHTEYKGLQYDNISDLFDLPDDKKEKKLKNRIAIPGLTINKFDFKYSKVQIPFAELDLNLSVKNYASVSSGRLFIKPNLLNQKKYIPKRLKNRKSDIDLRYAYTDIDTLIYKIPENLIPEYIPQTVEYKTKFGYFKAETKFEDHKLYYLRKIVMNKGIFPPNEYDNLRKFFKQIVNSDKQTCVFKITE